jgi:hypothetical protein
LTDRISNSAKENNGIPTPENLETYDELHDYFIDQHIFTEYLTALSEMKVVYVLNPHWFFVSFFPACGK